MGLKRTVICILAFGVLIAMVAAIIHPRHGWLVLAIYAIFGLLTILFEAGRYKPTLTSANFQPTDERYLDPVTGQAITVFVDPDTQQRDYRPTPGTM